MAAGGPQEALSWFWIVDAHLLVGGYAMRRAQAVIALFQRKAPDGWFKTTRGHAKLREGIAGPAY